MKVLRWHTWTVVGIGTHGCVTSELLADGMGTQAKGEGKMVSHKTGGSDGQGLNLTQHTSPRPVWIADWRRVILGVKDEQV